MDAGDFDGHFVEEVGKLSKEQLEELAFVLMERNGMSAIRDKAQGAGPIAARRIRPI